MHHKWLGICCAVAIAASAFSGVMMLVNEDGVYLYNGYYPFPGATNATHDAAKKLVITASGMTLRTNAFYMDDVLIGGGYQLTSLYPEPDAVLTNTYAWMTAFTAPFTNAAPAANTPEISEYTRTADAGDTVAILGESMTNTFLVWAEGYTSYTNETAPVLLDGQEAALTLPAGIVAGDVYPLWPVNANGVGAPVLLNATEAWWIGPDYIAQGETFSVFGRNLELGNDGLTHIYIDGYGVVSNSAANPYKADFVCPPLTNGSYNVYASNGHGGKYGWSAPKTIVVYTANNWSAGTTNTTTATPDDAGDDYTAINSDIGGLSAGDTLYFPDGVYWMGQDFPTSLSGKRLLGQSTNAVIAMTSGFSDGELIGYGANMVFENLTFSTGENVNGKELVAFDSTDYNNRFINCLFTTTNQVITDYRGNTIAIKDAAHHIYFDGCKLYVTSSGTAYAKGSSIQIQHRDTRQIFWSNCDFYGLNDNNLMVRNWADEVSFVDCSLRNYDNSNPTNGWGWSKGRFYDGVGMSAEGSLAKYRDCPDNVYFGGFVGVDLCPRITEPFATTTITGFNGPTATVASATGWLAGDGVESYRMYIEDGPSAGNHATMAEVGAGYIVINKADWLTAWSPDPEIGDTISCMDYVDGNSGEGLMFESGTYVDHATATGGTSNTATFASIDLEDVSGDQLGLSAFIVEGRGKGQARQIASHTTTNITVAENWRVIPDNTSVIECWEAHGNFVAYDCNLGGSSNSKVVDSGYIGSTGLASTGIEPYGPVHNWIVDSCFMYDYNQGFSEQPRAQDNVLMAPQFFTYVANTTISNCNEGIERFPLVTAGVTEGVGLLGAVYRNNTLTGNGVAIDEQIDGNTDDPGFFTYLTVFDGNVLTNNTTAHAFEALSTYTNQVWANNTNNGTVWSP